MCQIAFFKGNDVLHVELERVLLVGRQVLLLVVIVVPCWYHRVSPKPRTAATCALQLAKDLLVRAATSS